MAIVCLLDGNQMASTLVVHIRAAGIMWKPLKGVSEASLVSEAMPASHDRKEGLWRDTLWLSEDRADLSSRMWRSGAAPSDKRLSYLSRRKGCKADLDDEQGH